MPVQTHQINLQGLSGGIFWASLFAVIFYCIGFSTNGWSFNGILWNGLWGATQTIYSTYSHQDWFKAVQAMACLGLIFLAFAFILIFLYNFIHSVSMSKSLILKLIVFCAFLSALSILIALCIYGSKIDPKTLHWSYAFAAIGGIFTLIVAILACVQMKRASII